MKRILLLLITVSLFACSNGQSPNVTGTGVRITAPPTEKTLVADETWIVASGKSSFRVICSNDKISQMLMQKFEHDGMTKFVYTKKKDRGGQYWECTFYFKNESWNKVAEFISTKCK